MDPQHIPVQVQSPRGWYQPRHLPHCDAARLQLITYRLEDSLPASAQDRIRQRLCEHAPGEREARYRSEVEAVIDRGLGSCLLREDRCAACVLDSWIGGADSTVVVLEWVIMPNHVHVLVDLQDKDVAKVVQRWKGSSARRINVLVDRQGSLWQRDYWDRLIRDEAHLARAIRYVHMNPVLAGLVDRPEDWRWSSASSRWPDVRKVGDVGD